MWTHTIPQKYVLKEQVGENLEKQQQNTLYQLLQRHLRLNPTITSKG